MAERLARAALGVALLGLVVLPLGNLFVTALSDGPSAALLALGDPAGSAILTTLLVGGATTLGAVGIGTAAAVATERGSLPGRGVLRAGMLLPLLVPGFVSALSWVQAYGPGGLSHDLLGLELPGLYGLPGVIAVTVVETVPITYLVVAAALATRSEPDMERAARAAGAGRWRAAATVTLPLLAPALGAAAVLAFVFAVNAFGVPAILGTPARVVTVTVRIYQDLALSSDPAAFVRATVLAGSLVLLAVVTVGSADALLSTGRAVRTGTAGGATGPARRGGWWTAGLLWCYLALTLIIPLLALVLASVTRAVGLPPTPEHWTLGNYAAALSGRAWEALGHSALLAALSALAVVALAGLVLALRRGALRRLVSIGVALPLAVPGSALAVAILLTWGNPLRDTLLLIGVAYVAKFWAIGHRTLVGAADAQSGAPLLAARAAGASRWEALLTITVPLMRPAILGSLGAVFLLAFHELTMSSLLHGPGTATLAVVILNLQELGDVASTSALAVVLSAISLAGAAGLLLVTRRRP